MSSGVKTQEILKPSLVMTMYKTAIEKLDQYFMPKMSVYYKIFYFTQARQKAEETVDQFVTRLCRLAIHCEFTDLDKELKSTVIQHCKSKHLRRFALREDKLTLDKILSKARVLETNENQAEGMEQASTSVDIVWLLQNNNLNPRTNRLFTFSTRFQCMSSVWIQLASCKHHMSSHRKNVQ